MSRKIREILLAGVTCAVLLSGCKKKEPVFALANAIYVCMTHPEITRDNPGKCPVCGKTLVPLEVNSSEVQYSSGIGSGPEEENHE